MIEILTFSSLYPNAAQPEHGVFVEARLRELLSTGEVGATVVAPVPWFPLKSERFGRYAAFSRAPRRERRFDVDVLHPRYPVVPKVGMTIAPLLMAAGALSCVRRLVSRRRVDLVDAHYLFPDGVAAAIIAGFLRRPFVLTARGSDVNVIMRYRVPRRMILWAAGRAAKVITVSAALKAELVGRGVPAEHVCVIRNGVDLDAFRPAADAPVRGSDGRLLMVGHLKAGKGHGIAIDALGSLPGFHLTIAGDGPLRAALEERASANGVAARVEFLGRVPHGELARHYAAADALLLPSEREGMPNVVLESLACGTPVIATDVGGIPEVVTDSVAGVLIDAGTPAAVVTAVERLFADLPDRSEVRRFAEQYHWRASTERQLTLFRQVLKGET